MWREAWVGVVGAVLFVFVFATLISLLLTTGILPEIWSKPGHMWLNDTTIEMRLRTTTTTTTTTTHPKAAEFCITTATTTEALQAFVHANATTTLVSGKYVLSDAVWFQQWAPRVGFALKHVPRVLLFTWIRPGMWLMMRNEVYWKACYAHAHRFDIVFTSSQHFDTLKWGWPDEHPHLEHSEELVSAWAWVPIVQEFVLSGKYDYIFMMTDDTAIQEIHLDFPVWAWDRGHDITVMDQYHFRYPDGWGYNLNSVLFKATNFTAEFLKELFDYRKGRPLLNDQGAFMDLVLHVLDREAVEEGRNGYNGECASLLQLEKPDHTFWRLDSAEMRRRSERLSFCFFRWLDLLVGPYGQRGRSKRIGFSPTYDRASGRLPEAYSKPSVLGPWANCWRNPRKWWNKPWTNCFAYRWNGAHMPMIPGEASHKWNQIVGQCPDPTFDWRTSRYNTVVMGRKKNDWDKILILGLVDSPKTSPWHMHFGHDYVYYSFVEDAARLANWSRLHNHVHEQSMPRALIYTWCTLDTFIKFVNEAYWKSCYAHMHQFSLLCASQRNFTSVLDFFTRDNSLFSHIHKDFNEIVDYDVQSHAEEDVWPWVDDVQKHLFSGKYDYVFLMSEDTLIQETHVQFPIWAWDAGHDITLMDQHHFDLEAYGLNQNSILFKPTTFTRKFLEALREYQGGFYLQGDNGPFMETLLVFLGHEAEAEGRDVGYNRRCSKHLKLEESSEKLEWFETQHWEKLNDLYSKCFFTELDRLVGPFGARKSKHIGFSQTFLNMADGGTAMPEHRPDLLNPWANCWSGVRTVWSFPERNCFALRWNRPPFPDVFGKVQGNCPDPTFDWQGSPMNPVSRGLKFTS